jgi:hypothetical protein
MGYGESVAQDLDCLDSEKRSSTIASHPIGLDEGIVVRLPTMHPEPRGGGEVMARGGYVLAGQILELDAEERKLHAAIDAGVDALGSYAYGSSEVVTESPRGSSRRTDNCELEHVVYAGTLEERNADWHKGPFPERK